MRRREFLRAAVGAVAGLAIGAPVPRPRRLVRPGVTHLDGVAVWTRVITAEEQRLLWEECKQVLQTNLGESRFFGVPWEGK